MNKKIIAMLLALITVFSAVVLTVNAENDSNPSEVVSEDVSEEITAPAYEQWEVGDVIAAGGEIRSLFGAASIDVIYTANVAEDAGFVIESELSTRFRDSIADLVGVYGGVYKAKNIGDVAMLYYDANESAWINIAPGAVVGKDDTWVDEALRKFLPKEITIDFTPNDGSVIGYVTFVGWEVIEIIDDVSGMTVQLNAKWAVREPEAGEQIVEVLFGAIYDLIDKISDFLNAYIPNFILTWAELLGYNQ